MGLFFWSRAKIKLKGQGQCSNFQYFRNFQHITITQWLIIVQSQQMRHCFICFWVWEVDLLGYFFGLGSRSR